MVSRQQAHLRNGRGPLVRWVTAVLIAAPLITLASPALAQDSFAPSREYDACIAMAMQEPEYAFERAIAWRDLGGGEAAEHCVAVALYGLGHFGEAAMRLEDLASGPLGGNDMLRVALLGQAGNAWMMTGENERAYAALTTGLEIEPENVELLIDRSLARAELDDMWGAVDDLNMVLDIEPRHVNALVFRASAYRYLGSLELAADDANRALAMNPDHVAAYLERGNVRRLQGDDVGARDDWIAVLRRAPQSPAAEAARHNLERLDVDVD